jgi:hypothetical protein
MPALTQTNPVKDERAAKFARKWQRQVKYSIERRAKVLLAGEEFRRYVIGTNPVDAEPPEEGGTNWDYKVICAHGVLRSTIVPSVISRPATFTSRARSGANEVLFKRGRVQVEIAKYIYREQGMHQQSAAVLDDSMTYGDGFAEIDFDPERNLPRHRWISAERVLLDCETDGSPFAFQQRWRGVQQVMPLFDAKALWPDHEFKPVRSARDDSDEDAGDTLPSALVRIVRIYVKGDNPYRNDGKLAAKPGETVESPSTSEADNDKAGDTEYDPYSGKDELLIFEQRGSAESGVFELVARQDWPFPCDDFPIQSLRLTLDVTGPYSHSIYQPAHGLQEMQSWALAFYNTDLHRTAQRKFIYKKAAWNGVNIRDLLENPENLTAIGVDNDQCLPSRGGLEKVDFGQPNPGLKEALSINANEYERVTALDELRAEGRSHRTATDAQIMNQAAQLRLGYFADQVEYFIRDCMKKALQCALYRMTAEQVADVVGPEMLEFAPEVDSDGSQVMVSEIWPDSLKDVEAIRRNVDIQVEPRSMRFVTAEQEVQDLAALHDRQMNFVGMCGKLGLQVQPAPLVKTHNAVIRRMAELLHVPNPEEILLDLDSVLLSPPEPELGSGPSTTETQQMNPDGTHRVSVTHKAGDVSMSPQALSALSQSLAAVGGDVKRLPVKLQQAVQALRQRRGAA